MQLTPVPIEARNHGSGASIVVACGLLTTALSLFGVYLLGVIDEDIHVMGWYLNYVIPAGAILVGMAASSGYGLASWLKGVKITWPLLLGILFLQICAYSMGQYIEFRSLELVYEDGSPVDFITYYHWTAISFAWVRDDGSVGAPLGMLGYGLRALEIVGFSLGSLLAPALLRSKAYCEVCSRYMVTSSRVLLPASIESKRIKKRDAEARATYEQEQQEALDEGMAKVGALSEAAQAGDSEAFRSILAEHAGQAKEVSRLPVRIMVLLSSCPVCELGAMKISLVSGQGQNVKTQEMGNVLLRAHFAREVKV